MQFHRKLVNQTWENGEKPSSGPGFNPFGPNSGCKFFFKYLALSVTRYHGQLSWSTISESNLMMQSWENLVTDGRTDGQADKQMDESDFRGRSPTNIERPKAEILVLIEKKMSKHKTRTFRIFCWYFLLLRRGLSYSMQLNMKIFNFSV